MTIWPRVIAQVALADRTLERLWQAGRGVLQAYLANALTPNEQTALTLQVYASWLDSHHNYAGVPDWEQAWFLRVLPSVPARILVGAAGTGREVTYLMERGYQVDAFEPVSLGFQQCRLLMAGEGRCFRASFQDLVNLHRFGTGELTPLLDRAPYDAVILGWSSLSHVFGRDHRLDLMACCASLAPAGPILASYHARNNRPRKRRSERLGSAVGELHARLRGLQLQAEPLLFAGHFGLSHPLTTEEVEGLASHIGRRALWDGAQMFPHVTFARPREGA